MHNHNVTKCTHSAICVYNYVIKIDKSAKNKNKKSRQIDDALMNMKKSIKRQTRKNRIRLLQEPLISHVIKLR